MTTFEFCLCTFTCNFPDNCQSLISGIDHLASSLGHGSGPPTTWACRSSSTLLLHYVHAKSRVVVYKAGSIQENESIASNNPRVTLTTQGRECCCWFAAWSQGLYQDERCVLRSCFSALSFYLFYIFTYSCAAVAFDVISSPRPVSIEVELPRDLENEPFCSLGWRSVQNPCI